MNKIISIIIILAMTSMSTVQVFADNEKAGPNMVFVEETARNIYEASVIGELAGRCGKTASGTKGLVFEILCKDKMNLKNIFNKDFTTRLTHSPNAKRADLVAYNSSNQNVGYYQCKDILSKAGIRDTYTRTINGQYDFTTLIGTKESAEGFNAYAKNNGMIRQMQNSGISSKTTSRIADKAFGKPKNKNALSCGFHAANIAAITNSVVSLIECLVNQEDFYESFGHVIVQSIYGYVNGFTTGYVVEITSSAIAALSGGSVSMLIIPVAISAGVGFLTCYVLDKIMEDTDIENTIAELTREFGDKVKLLVNKMKNKAICISDDIKDFVLNTKNTVMNKAESTGIKVKESVVNAKEKTVSFFTGLFHNKEENSLETNMLVFSRLRS